jgi:hypothetical protein
MLYRIYVTGPTPDRSETRRRADAALLCAERLAYDTIAGYAGLDTAWGRKAMDEVQAIDPRKGGTVRIQNHFLVFTSSHVGD